MNTTRTRRGIVSALVLALTLAMTALPAHAAANGSASLVTPNVFAGTTGQVVLRVQNNASPGTLGVVGAGTAIDAVQVFVPTDVYVPNQATAPEGWSGFYDADFGVAYFFADSDSTAIAPGGARDFTLPGAVGASVEDTSGEFFVQVSDDGGMTTSSAGKPLLNVLTLAVEGVTLRKPGFATDTDGKRVTANQDNASFDVTVRSYSSADRDITAQVARKSGSSTISEGTKTAHVTAGTVATINVPATFGDAGSLDLDVVATSAGGSTSEALPYSGMSVQAPFAATYRVDSLSPQAVVPGNAVSFKLTIDKTGAQPAYFTNAAANDGKATFSFADGAFSAEYNPELGAGDRAENLTFPSTLVDASILDGSYDPTVRLVGFDGNGALIDTTVQNIDDVILDRLFPAVTVNADPDDPAVAGATEAATDGWNIAFSGKVTLGDAADATLCEKCTLVTAEIVQRPSNATLPADVTLSNGRISGNDSFDFADGTEEAYLRVVVQKPNELRGTGDSNVFEVDLLPPALNGAELRRNHDMDYDYVNVFFSEIVATQQMAAADWKVDNNAVQEVTAKPGPDGATMVQLRLAQQYDDRNVTPTVAYEPLLGTRRAYDRVELSLADQVINAVDRIVPDAPVIETVMGMATQDGEYWTNDSTPSVTLSNLVAGDLIILCKDENTDGACEQSEEIARETAGGSEHTIAATDDLGNTDDEFTLLALMRDDANNFGPIDSATVNLDFTLPTILSATQSGNQVTVTFNEVVPRGRNAAFDWVVTAEQDGTSRSRPISSVTGEGNTRTLTVDSNAYDPAKGDVTEVFFRYRGPEGDRYEDRATNRMLDQSTSNVTR